MTRYPYTKELHGPQFGTGNLRLTNPFLKLFFALNHARAKRFRPLPGTTIRKIAVAGHAGAELDCYVVTPVKAGAVAPAIVYLHGGGFFGGLDRMHFQNAGFYANELGFRVFLPVYRTSYRHKFPIPVEDCYAAAKTIYEQAESLGVDRDRFILYGDSAGGCLAAAVALMARDRGAFQVAFQMLIYPVTDYLAEGDSLKEYPLANWSASANRQMWVLYLGGAQPENDGYASPLHAASLAGLPPAYVEPQEIDTLRDEGVAYARRLAAAGVPTILNVVAGSYHAFEGEYPAAFVLRALAHRCEVLRNHFANR